MRSEIALLNFNIEWNGNKQRVGPGVKCKIQSSPRSCWGHIMYTRYMSRIHYPMTYTNYPFNAIWAIVKLSRPSSRTFPATLTQKHQLEKSLVSKHCVDTGRSFAFVFRTGHVKIGVVSREWSGKVWARACVAVAGDRLLAAEWALGGGAKLAPSHSQRAYENHQLRLSPH